MISVLSFIVKNRPFQDFGDVFQTERSYLDFCVSGQSLAELLNLEPDGFIGLLGWGIDLEYEKLILKEFTLEKQPELSSGRVILYGCPECGDIGCGAITIKIEKKTGRYIWKEFGIEGHHGFDLEEYAHIGPFHFDEKSYRNSIDKIRKSIEKRERRL